MAYIYVGSNPVWNKEFENRTVIASSLQEAATALGDEVINIKCLLEISNDPKESSKKSYHYAAEN